MNGGWYEKHNVVHNESRQPWISLPSIPQVSGFPRGCFADFATAIPGAWAQATGSILGTITDSSGAVIVGAKGHCHQREYERQSGNDNQTALDTIK